MFFNGSTFIIDDTVEIFGFDIDTNLIRFRGTDLYTEISNGQHTFWTNGTERFKINATEVKVSHQLNVTGDLTVDTDTLFVDASEDSVGIGLTNPSDYSADELVISVPDDSGMTLVSGTTDTAYIRFADGTAAADQANFISHDHNTNTLTVFSQAKVSIGILEAEVAYFTDTNFYVDKSTTINDTLTVNGNATFTGKVTAQSTASNTAGQFAFSTGGNDVGIREDTSGGFNIDVYKSGTGYINPLTIDSSGIVKINTTAVNARFRVDEGGTGEWVAGFKHTGTTPYGVFIDTSGNTSTGYTLGCYTNTGTGLFLKNDGNLGIGTNSPYAKLEINDGTNINLGIKVGQTDTTAVMLNAYNDAVTANIPMEFRASKFAFDVGNVGIGVTPYSYSRLTTEGVDNTSSNYAFIAYQENTNAILACRNDGQVTIPSGNLGIGTNSPDAKLHIYGSSTVSEMYLGEDAAADKAGILKYTQGDGSGTGVITLSHWGNTSTTQSLAKIWWKRRNRNYFACI